MKLPLQISFRNCPQSPAVEDLIEKKAHNLERFFPRIMGCRVMVESPHKHQHKGKLYQVKVDLTLPGKEIIAGESSPLRQSHSDVFVAIRDSFKATRRQLQDAVRRRRGSSRPGDVIDSHIPME